VETPFTDILVPLDGSPAAERALAPALALVRRTGVPLRVLSRALPDEKEALAAYLAGIADRHATVTDVETQVVDRESIPDAIVEGLGPGTLVCMSSHGRGGLARVMMGSVAEALLRSLGRPVLMVGPHVSEEVGLTGRIVACLDGSAESERTLEPARQWAAALDLALWLVTVAEPGRPGEGITNRESHASGELAALAGRLEPAARRGPSPCPRGGGDVDGGADGIARDGDARPHRLGPAAAGKHHHRDRAGRHHSGAGGARSARPGRGGGRGHSGEVMPPARSRRAGPRHPARSPESVVRPVRRGRTFVPRRNLPEGGRCSHDPVHRWRHRPTGPS
jgi:nucleotide-binding universal stress UspA family protein